MKKNVFLIGLLTLIFTSCSSDDPAPVNEEEIITTMTVVLTATGQNTVTLQSRDLDGDGPDEPVITISGPLTTNTTYTGSITLLNETVSPVEDITEEVEEEDEEHQFFYQTSGSVASTAYNDEDSNGNPVGLNFTLTTGGTGPGTIQITLRHEPNKSASGVANGDITNADGETDIAQLFNVFSQ
ncbi:type 1 periplasmic binding fold superfamily protein [Ascidiimonas sp. W6]|uniref:type 1 periplasmic binding fold superfamily protein n=1 Tax=Ascidiimonas meishanensis TaxID=3128903 RepID=UPI0030EC9253